MYWAAQQILAQKADPIKEVQARPSGLGRDQDGYLKSRAKGSMQ